MDSVYVAVISNYVCMFIFQWDRTMFVLQWDWQAETVYSNQAVHAFSYLSISLSLCSKNAQNEKWVTSTEFSKALKQSLGLKRNIEN